MQITYKNVSADYVIGPIRTPDVLKSINLTIEPGSFTAILGHTGAGKTSLIKTMNGLLEPVQGQIIVGENIITTEVNKDVLNAVRKDIGMVFQFPESQLFADTVEKDICFGPLNFGIPLKEAKEIARDVIKQVGLDQCVLSKSPFSLSGGEKRRVAIAGVLATKPKVLILDEPGAGLDPEGKQEVLTLLTQLNKEHGMTIIIVTHDMDDVAIFARDVVVMENGRVVKHGTVKEVFSNQEQLACWRLDVPEALRFQMRIERETGITFPGNCLTVNDLADALIKVGLV